MTDETAPASHRLKIEDYGVIGDLETVALVGRNGSIDFFCFPRFDSPSLFARLLDHEKGGYFRIGLDDGDMNCRQMYLPETNVLVTRFHSDEGILEVIDFMPLDESGSRPSEIIRIVNAIQVDLPVELVCAPAFDYARDGSSVERADNGDLVFSGKSGDGPDLRLRSSVAIEPGDGETTARFRIKENQPEVFVMLCGDCADTAAPEDGDELRAFAQENLEATIQYWRDWSAKTRPSVHWPREVHRSALVLKLLFSGKHGSIVAAPTFGLPEEIGGPRNWDYRYCWIRDSAFTIYAMLKLGHPDEAAHYVEWISQRYQQSNEDGSLNLLYRVDGSTDLTEEELDHLAGYKDSKPVRVGNGAHDQLQLDIYGELIDSIYLAHKFSTPTSHQGWEYLTRTIDYVCANWQRPDEGIWEIRAERKHFLHSRLMCWVAVDRGIRLSDKASLPAPVERWRETRDAIHHDIHANFWNEELQSFVQYQGADAVDAALLLMPMVKFISPADPRWTTTLEEIERQLVTDSFVRRYRTDDGSLDGISGSDEGNFTMCSFWYVEVLARSGQLRKARLLFEKMTGYANHLGLFSEQLSKRGEHLGNFPQAFTHLALVSAAFALERAMEEGGRAF